jgi:hypothetical protein
MSDRLNVAELQRCQLQRPGGQVLGPPSLTPTADTNEAGRRSPIPDGPRLSAGEGPTRTTVRHFLSIRSWRSLSARRLTTTADGYPEPVPASPQMMSSMTRAASLVLSASA